jgi:hypothetical protein
MPIIILTIPSLSSGAMLPSWVAWILSGILAASFAMALWLLWGVIVDEWRDRRR